MYRRDIFRSSQCKIVGYVGNDCDVYLYKSMGKYALGSCGGGGDSLGSHFWKVGGFGGRLVEEKAGFDSATAAIAFVKSVRPSDGANAVLSDLDKKSESGLGEVVINAYPWISGDATRSCARWLWSTTDKRGYCRRTSRFQYGFRAGSEAVKERSYSK